MNKILPLLGLLLLTACSPKVVQVPPSEPIPSVTSSSASSVSSETAVRVTPWDTHFVYNDEKAISIYSKLYQCLDHVSEGCTKCYGEPEERPEEMKAQAAACDRDYWDAIKIKDNPPTFYAVSRQAKGPDPYEDFVVCEHMLVSPMYDLPEDYSTEQFRNDIRDCLNQFPKSL